MTALNTFATVSISVSTDGAQADGGSAFSFISADGRFVGFQSDATNLASDDKSAFTDVFLRDTVKGTTTLVSIGEAGAPADNGSYSPRGSISDGGRFVVFQSNASNLTDDDTNGDLDVFLRDMKTGTTTCMSLSNTETASNGISENGQITGDGRYVAFDSFATDLLSNDGNAHADVFVRDTKSGSLSVVSVSNDGTQGNGDSIMQDISAGGRYVVFRSAATNLVSGDANGRSDIFMRDTAAHKTVLVSVATTGEQAESESLSARVSDNGRYVAFDGDSTNLAASDSDISTDVFLRDTKVGTTTLVSVSSDGVAGNGNSYLDDISADGRFVVFTSDAFNLVSNDTNGLSDIFLRDTVAGTTARLSVGGFEGENSDGVSYDARISADGRFVTFETNAANLGKLDNNGARDIVRVSLFATDGIDNMVGTDGRDTISGLGGSDFLHGGRGDDRLDGGKAGDTLLGGSGDDILTGGASADELKGDSGTDTASYATAKSGVTVSLAKSGINTGDAKGDTFSSIENLAGSTHADKLFGNGGKNVLAGGAGDDKLDAGGSNDRLDGGSGKDRLTGGSGHDAFVFDAKLDAGKNVDAITDFSHADDAVWLDDDIFTKAGHVPKGDKDGRVALSKDAFWASDSGKAHDKSDRILYDRTDGHLLYDADGSDSGKAVQFADLAAHLKIDASDFLIVA